MASAIEESIKEIAIKHGVSVTRNDPILILQTMHERLLEKQALAQQEMLEQFKSEMELVSSRWQNDTKEKAEKTLNAALDSSKKLIDSNTKESINEAVSQIKNTVSSVIEASKTEILNSKKNNQYMLIASGVMFLLSIVFFIASLN